MAMTTEKAGNMRQRAFKRSPHYDSPIQNHGYLFIILVAFACGYFLGEKESTPSTMTSVVHKLAETAGLRVSEPSVAELLGKLQKARRKIEEQTIRDYGDYYGRLFNDRSALEHVFVQGAASKARLRRRLLSKVLIKMDSPEMPVSFVWATAGDSSAAGHGNLFNQSYTAVLKDTIRDAFDTLGIHFEARNYGMGWYSSAPELSFCMEAVYGLDVDFLMWDFSMMDATRLHRLRLFGERTGLHSNRPILMVAADGQAHGYSEVVSELEEKGLGSILMDKMATAAVRARIPNTNEQLPPSLRYMICNGSIEGSAPCDDPMRFFQCDQDETEECLLHKYKTHAGCDHEKYQKSYHPGWKEHAFRGQLLAHFLLDALEEALIELEPVKHPYGGRKAVRGQTILERFRKEEVKDVNRFQGSVVPPDYSVADNVTVTLLTPNTLYRKPVVCHTAVLPSQSRYLGLSTESSKRGDYHGGYDLGQNKVLSKPVDGDRIPLTYDSSDRHRCASLKIDHRDYFYVKESDGWLRLTVPNRAETNAYRREAPEGLILMCLQVCPLDRCSDDFVGFGENGKHHGNLEMKVDGNRVTSTKRLDGCHFLEGRQGISWGAGQAGDGQYEIEMKLDIPKTGIVHSVKVSSIIVL